MSDTRVVLVKPGDLLVLGNVGHDVEPADVQVLGQALTEHFHIRVAVFAEDVDLAMVPGSNGREV